MIYVYDKVTGQFRMRIYPYFIEYCDANSRVLYVQDACGNFFTLTFIDRARLVACMEELRVAGSTDARCDVHLYNSNVNSDHEREIESDELEYGREIK